MSIAANIATVAAVIAAVAAQPSTFQRVASASGPMIFGLDAAIITATMIGTGITALTTAAQYSALIGFDRRR